MIEVLFACVLGVLLGILTGLIPGLHSNNLAVFIAALSFSLDPNFFVPLIVSLAISHTFFSFVPSILLGIPKEESYLSMLPGHKLVVEGKAHEALIITCIAGFFAGITASFLGLFLASVPLSYALFRPFIAPFLIFFLSFAILSSERKVSAFIVVFLSSLLGLLAIPIVNKNPIFALISGFFAFPTILLSFFSKQRLIQKQKIEDEIHFELAPILLAIPASLLIAIFPGISSASSSFLLSKPFFKTSKRSYLALIGASTTASVILALFVFLLFGKARIALANFIPKHTSMFFLFSISLFAISFAALIFLMFSKIFVIALAKIDYKVLNILAFFALSLFLIFFTDFHGILACVSATLISLYASFSKVPRSYCMSFLITPSILFYLWS